MKPEINKSMNKLEQFRNLEKKYRVEDISIAGFKLWPYLRIYFSDQIVFNRDRRVKVSTSTLRIFLKSWFYGFFNLFGRYDCIVFSTTEQRKEINGKRYDRCDFLPAEAGKVLFIELPVPRHFPYRKLASKYVISKMVFYGFEILYARLFSGSLNLEGEEVIKEVEKKMGVKVAYQTLSKRLVAQYKVMRFFTAIWKPKAAFFVAPYNFMGHVMALKEKGVAVIEMQHGTINKNHYAYYISKQIEGACYPDYLLTFGENEEDVFDENNHYINRKNVHAVGSFYLDYLANDFRGDEAFNKMVVGYEKTIAVTAQDALEEQWVPFLKTVAEGNHAYLYVVAPRQKKPVDYYSYHFPGNVVYAPWLNTYEIIALCDFHSTINSTAALEAPSLGTQNLLFNIENRAKAYYQSTLKDERVTKFADSPSQYLELLTKFKKLEKEQIRAANRKVVIKDFGLNLKNVIKVILRSHEPQEL